MKSFRQLWTSFFCFVYFLFADKNNDLMVSFIMSLSNNTIGMEFIPWTPTQYYTKLHQNTLLSQLSARSKISALSPATWRLRCRRRLRTISRRIFTADHRPPVTALSVISIWIDTLLDACRIYSFNAGLEIWNGVRLEPFLSFGFAWLNNVDKLCFIKAVIFPIGHKCYS